MSETAKSPVPFTQYIACPSCSGTGITVCSMCKGTGWKRRQGGYNLIVCPGCCGEKKTVCKMCRGKRKLPEWDTDGRWQKRVVSELTRSHGEMMS